MGSSRPVVALVTDFGSLDWYVGAVKGAILSASPSATIVDITHNVPAFDVQAASFCLYAASTAFGPGTVFVCVVDPGVGTARRALCATDGRHVFVGPDNGVLSMPAHRAGAAWQAHEIQNVLWQRKPVSPTFHGRDIFAPAAARLAEGAHVAEAGPPISADTRLPFPRVLHAGAGNAQAEVFYVDRFGNLFLSVRPDDLGLRLEAAGDQVGLRVRVANVWVTGGTARTFGDGAPQELVLYWGSSGFLELGVNRGSAAALLGIGVGAPAELHWMPRQHPAGHGMT